MTSRPYHLVDVFTDRAFGGNPLAVFLDGRGLSDELMQAIAKEFNLSETTFVLPPQDAAHDFRVRIFTPAQELPMAGHPTVGTTFVLTRAGLVRPGDGRTNITLEEGVGPIPVAIDWENGKPSFIEMKQPLPKFGPPIEDRAGLAEMLSLETEAIRDDLPIQVVSCGVPFLFVPVKTLEAMRRIRFRIDVEGRLNLPSKKIFAFTTETEFPGSQVHSRMFAPSLGVPEDAATGGATGPLGCYLVQHRVLGSEGELRCVSEQGIEMGRPSFLHIRIQHTGDAITAVHVGGTCCYMGSGQLELADG
ncbi:MAG TPA: PhzF family phenazine biosynthesis protein [Chthoniobacterales bacterium]|nr:PhzF family phenazine biosynthesis protein [Chthoniobacterales bacterium]